MSESNNVLAYYCNNCRSVFSPDGDLEIDDADYKICSICGCVLEECDGTT